MPLPCANAVRGFSDLGVGIVRLYVAGLCSLKRSVEKVNYGDAMVPRPNPATNRFGAC